MASRTPDEDLARVDHEIRVEGMVRLAPDTVYEADVHAPDGLVLGPGSTVLGDVHTDGPLELAEGAEVRGQLRPTEGEDPVDEVSLALGRLAERTEAGDACADEAAETVLDLVREHQLDAPTRGWSADTIRDAVFAGALAPTDGIAVENVDAGSFVLRIRRSRRTAGTDRPPILARVAEALAQAADPALDVHPLSSWRTRGDIVLLVGT